ncbi:MAG: UDP-N-acetylglucosamine--N-acetylmuramyl-(pentapeptide) pyrophosphoryl-undecaprenol N-acetylglucosamine transferase [Clostridia bacterium]|nr:UDP-N-acetylglucosamine--N-acetylmuramyl-(pentapeptide) pyrophosphoryl-undecaprenol N-acetylglucosamine transferase [Clostridia bacterium]
MGKGLRVILTGGGTGGHIYPAIAIADYIKEHVPGSEFLFIGKPDGREQEIVPAAGYRIEGVKISGINHRFSPSTIKAVFEALTAPRAARKIIAAFKPDIIIGTGGYVCWPALKAGQQMHIPTAAHESNVLPGMAVRKLEAGLDVVFTNFEETKDLLKHPEKVLRVGNPVRSAFGHLSREEAREKLNIPPKCAVVLSYGGSLGSERINDAILEMCCRQASGHPEILFIHANGKRYNEQMNEKLHWSGLEGLPNVRFCDYLNDMPLYMSASDIVICRAGAMTVSELAVMKKPAILIPSPNVADNHQYKNAKALADRHAAVLLEEKDLLEDRLDKEVLKLLETSEWREYIGEKIHETLFEDPGGKILEKVLELTNKG